MIRILKCISILFFTLLFFGCSDSKSVDDPPQPPAPVLTVTSLPEQLSATGGNATLTFTTNRSWTLAPELEQGDDGGWFTVAPLSGDAGETIRVSVSVEPNEGYIDRGLTLVLQADVLEERIEVTQLKKNVILAGDNRREVTGEAQELSIEVQSNVEYAVEIKEGGEWLEEIPRSRAEGLKTETHRFRIAQNTQEAERTGIIVFKDSGSELSDELSVVQAAWVDPDPERTALNAIYEAAAGSGWTQQENWGSDKPLNEWYGVETDDEGHVTALRLPKNNLAGNILEPLGKLTALRHIDLSWNMLGGEISTKAGGEMRSDLDNLSELETINLSHNSFEGGIPGNWYKLERLQYVNLSSNRLKGFAFPVKWNGLFENGRTLDLILNDNYLHDEVPDFILNNPDWDRLALQFIRQYYQAGGGIVYDKDIHLPDFTFTDLSDGSRRSIREVYSANKLTMLLQWDPLQEQSDTFIATVVRRFHTLFGKQGFAVVGITPEGDRFREAAKSYIRQRNIPWTAVCDYSDSQGRRTVLPDYPYPSYLLVDQHGTVISDMFSGQYIESSLPAEPIEADLLARPFQHSDYLNGIFKDTFGPSTYESSDFTMDKKYETLQKATKGNGINVVLMGDAFTDIDIESGFYRDMMDFAMESFFAIEPTKSYREYFNVYLVYAVSRKPYIGDDRDMSALGTILSPDLNVENNLKKLPDYAYAPVGFGGAPFVSITVNDGNFGVTYMEQPSIRPSYAFSGYTFGSRDVLRGCFIHEAVGHGFGLVGDEYVDYSGSWTPGEIPEYQKTILKTSQKKGWYLNLSLTDNQKSVFWSHLIGHPRYPYVGVYEGGFYYPVGVWRSEDKSVMDNHTKDWYFNTICRELIVKRILELSGEEYTFEKFLAKDSDEGRPKANRSSPQYPTERKNERRHCPPVFTD